jgi:hypothetical protein
MHVGIQRHLARATYELPESRIAGEVGAEGKVIDEVAD